MDHDDGRGEIQARQTLISGGCPAGSYWMRWSADCGSSVERTRNTWRVNRIGSSRWRFTIPKDRRRA